jgi:hypothetical protein
MICNQSNCWLICVTKLFLRKLQVPYILYVLRRLYTTTTMEAINNHSKRRSITASQKKRLCEKKVNSLLSTKNYVLAKEFGISTAQVSQILHNKEKWLSIVEDSFEAKAKRQRSPRYPSIEEALALWLEHATGDSQVVTGAILQKKALDFALLLGESSFTGSSGWLDKFKKRISAKQHAIRGEANSAPLERLPEMREELRDIIKDYELADTYNCDETGLYWKMLPSKTISTQHVIGTKKSKDRTTVLLTCNATGSHKLKPLVIHKYKNPRALRHIDKSSLPVTYYWNKQAWMQSSIFNSFLKSFNNMMRRENRHVILLLDNFSSHTVADYEGLSNVRVHFLPPNTTSHLQPLDSGIIYSFKVSSLVLVAFLIANLRLFLFYYRLTTGNGFVRIGFPLTMNRK